MEVDWVVIWSYLVLLLAVPPWLLYVIVLLIYLLSILYGSVTVSIFQVCYQSVTSHRSDAVGLRQEGIRPVKALIQQLSYFTFRRPCLAWSNSGDIGWLNKNQKVLVVVVVVVMAVVVVAICSSLYVVCCCNWSNVK